MIFVDQSFGLPGAQLRVRGGVSRGPGLYYANLNGIRWDGRVLPRGRHERRDWYVLLFVGQGQVRAEPSQRIFDTGSVVLLREWHIFGTSEETCVRTLDRHSEGIALRLPSEYMLETTDEPVSLAVSETFAASLRAATLELGDDQCNEQVMREQLLRLIRVCVAEGLLSPDALAAYSGADDDTTVRAQDALFPTVEHLSEQPMLVDVTERVDVGDRQVRRDVLKMQQEFDLFDRGFRETVHRWRLTAAVLLLSAKELSATEVAGAVGYGSLSAMGRAFKKANLPTPTRVRRQLLG